MENICRLESDSESYFKESSDNEQEVAAPLNIQVNVNLESLEPPPPQPESPPVLPVPIPVGELAPVRELPDDGTKFRNYFTKPDIFESKNWAVETRARIIEEGYVVEAPMVSQSFWAFLKHFHGQQCEVNFLQPAAGPLFDQMLAYIARYARLTNLNKSLLRQYFEGCSASEKAEKNVCWRSRVASSKSSKPLSSVGRRGPFSPRWFFCAPVVYVLCISLLYGFFLWCCTANRNIFGF